MDESSGYIIHVDRISKEEFNKLFTREDDLSDWFSEKELAAHPFPRHAGSLAARYLVKRRIKDFIGDEIMMNEIEIINDELGKPEVIIGNRTKPVITEKGMKRIICSLSHSRNYAVAMTVFVYE